MPFVLPFKPGMQVVELGGGDKPSFRPNIDVRPGPTVDLVADFNQPLPVAPDQFEGLYSRYCLEHVSYRQAPRFLADCARILKPGGVAVFVVPNTLAQMEKAIATPVWTDEISSMLYGDQDYPENSHKLALSPEYAVRLCKQAGFFEVRTIPLPEWLPGQSPYDMVIEARKSAAEVLRGLPS